MTERVVLASGSPRRKLLLESRGFDVTVVKPDFDESSVSSESPEQLVALLAAEKNRTVAGGFPDLPVISADTAVACRGKILGKPGTEREAYEMLSLLSGRVHSVFTGLCISYRGSERIFTERSDVEFYPLTDKQIRMYIAGGSPFDKAGGYGIQDDIGIGFVRAVTGELSNVIGLPMGRVISELQIIKGERE